MFHHLMNRFAVFVIGLSADAPDRRGERRGDSRCDRPDRGDVPGWVLITLMTAGLVVALWALAGEAFTSMFQDAMNKVRGAG
ncbi:hypothetical protein [Brevibacterium sp. FME17]|uniref:hypothetical protein n=1 Tax=Brevibacterium sp. FME17 TaxID=2742606 RepID=UPI001D00EF19|nr:hypothetical protein [Brevibacterium sp. FME17]